MDKIVGGTITTPMNTYTKKQTEALVDDKLGDVATALDTILAMQSAYIEGENLEIPKDPETGNNDFIDDLIPPEGDGFDY